MAGNGTCAPASPTVWIGTSGRRRCTSRAERPQEEATAGGARLGIEDHPLAWPVRLELVDRGVAAKLENIGSDADPLAQQVRNHVTHRDRSEAEPVAVLDERILGAEGIEEWLEILHQIEPPHRRLPVRRKEVCA